MKIETLLDSQGCQSLQEQTVLDYDKFFKDPDFGPEHKLDSIYLYGDVEEKKLQDLDRSFKTLKWLRPAEIAPIPRFSGFMELNLS